VTAGTPILAYHRDRPSDAAQQCLADRSGQQPAATPRRVSRPRAVGKPADRAVRIGTGSPIAKSRSDVHLRILGGQGGHRVRGAPSVLFLTRPGRGRPTPASRAPPARRTRCRSARSNANASAAWDTEVPSTPTATGASNATDYPALPATAQPPGHRLRTASVLAHRPNTSSRTGRSPRCPSTHHGRRLGLPAPAQPTGLPGSMCVITSMSGAIRCTTSAVSARSRRGSAWRTASFHCRHDAGVDHGDGVPVGLAGTKASGKPGRLRLTGRPIQRRARSARPRRCRRTIRSRRCVSTLHLAVPAGPSAHASIGIRILCRARRRQPVGRAPLGRIGLVRRGNEWAGDHPTRAPRAARIVYRGVSPPSWWSCCPLAVPPGTPPGISFGATVLWGLVWSRLSPASCRWRASCAARGWAGGTATRAQSRRQDGCRCCLCSPRPRSAWPFCCSDTRHRT